MLGIGRSTRLLRFVEAADKEYHARIRFGISTTTQDIDGEIVASKNAAGLDEATVRAALARLTGEIMQIPPMVSAIKVGGERLYRKARRGEEVERQPRRVNVRAFELVSFDPGEEARAEARIECSKGTYVRTLAADAGEALGTGAALEALRRTAIGRFGIEEAVALDAVTRDSVRPMEDAVAGYPRRMLDEDEARAIVQGRSIPAAGIGAAYAAFDARGLVAMMSEREGEARSLCVLRG